MKKLIKLGVLTMCLSALVACAHQANTQGGHRDPLTTTVFNPKEVGIFPVTSVIIEGETEVVLVDAQFRRSDAEKIVSMIQALNKELTMVFISHGDPDYYFGLDVIAQAFPNAKIMATPSTVAYIERTHGPKLAYWGPILEDEAPSQMIVPNVMTGDQFKVDGHTVHVKGLKGHNPKVSYLWIPSSATVLGGIPVTNNMHAWIADSQTVQARQQWRKTLDAIDALKPRLVIPGHYLGADPQGAESVAFIRQYLTDFETVAKGAQTSDQIIAAMKQRYPTLGGLDDLVFSAKVITGEQAWGQ